MLFIDLDDLRRVNASHGRQTGDRTLLSYLIKPLSDQLMRSFRER